MSNQEMEADFSERGKIETTQLTRGISILAGDGKMKKYKVNLVLLTIVGLMGYCTMIRADEEVKPAPAEITETLDEILQIQKELVITQNALLRTQNTLAAKLGDISAKQDTMNKTVQKIWLTRKSTR